MFYGRPFHITYLCRDDAGENVFLSMLTDWDLDAAFMTSSDPYLRLKVSVLTLLLIRQCATVCSGLCECLICTYQMLLVNL